MLRLRRSKGRSHNKKNGKFQTMSQIGVGGQKKTKISEIQIWTFKNPWGVSIFQKFLNYKFLSVPIVKKKIKTLSLPLFNVNVPK